MRVDKEVDNVKYSNIRKYMEQVNKSYIIDLSYSQAQAILYL